MSDARKILKTREKAYRDNWEFYTRVLEQRAWYEKNGPGQLWCAERFFDENKTPPEDWKPASKPNTATQATLFDGKASAYRDD